jgi:hypothetical protein
VVESQPSKLLVAGSIPVSRSKVEAFCGREADPELAEGEAGSPEIQSAARDLAMAFEQATIKIENERSFGELKAALDQVFAADRIPKYLKKLSGQNIRIRDWDAILMAGTLDVITGAGLGTARTLYQSLTVSDQAQMRELYLSKIEEVAPELRAKFNKLFRYY